MKETKQHMRSLKKEEHLVFKIGSGYYSIEVSQAYSIVEMSRIKNVLKSKGSVIGYISQRNVMFPVVDIHSKLGAPETDYTDNTCILVLELVLEKSKLLIGILIDSLLEITELKSGSINSNKEINSIFFNGSFVLKNNQTVKIINPEKIFTLKEIEEFNTTLEYKNN